MPILTSVMFLTAERTLQANYWKEHSVEPSVEAMMLDSQASKLDVEERPEVFSISSANVTICSTSSVVSFFRTKIERRTARASLHNCALV